LQERDESGKINNREGKATEKNNSNNFGWFVKEERDCVRGRRRRRNRRDFPFYWKEEE
jgi:hypothetical protein